MIDLNDVWQPPARFDLPEIRGRLAATALDWLPGLFPHGLLSPDRRTLRCADLAGRSPRKEGSCIIHLAGHHAGWGFDHATGESAGPIDLIHHATGLADRDLFEEAARLARLDLPAVARPVAAKPSHDLEIKRIIDGSISLAGTIGETYLKGRGIGNPRSPDLLYHDDLPDFEGRRGWPGLVGIVRDGAGNPVGGIHRTFLLDDGSDKAPPGKKMLGAIDSGSVRLAPMPADGDLGIAEGIETALSAWAIFGIPTWAALSAGGMRQWQWPEGTRRVASVRWPTVSAFIQYAST
jgi:putative DNA primase/helicase